MTRCWFHCATTRHLLPALQSVAVGAALHFDSRFGTVSRWWCCSAAASSAGCARCATAASSSTPPPPASHRQPRATPNCAARDGLLAPLPSPVNGLPVLWYRIQREERKGTKWVVTHTYESESSFLLDDGSGHCAVDPEGAEMLVTRQGRFPKRSRPAHHPVALIKHDPIYAIGEFATIGSISAATDTARQVRELLADWKRATARACSSASDPGRQR